MKRIDWSALRHAGALHVARDRARRLAAGEGAPDARDHAGGRGHARDDRHALRARRRDRPHARAARSRPQDAIRALDEHWDGSGHPHGLRGEEIPLLGRILCLAQTRRGVRAHDRRRAARYGDGAQAPRPLVRPRARRRAARASATTPPSGARSRTRARCRRSRGWEPGDRVLHADDDRLDRVAEAFARVIDAKSPYTARHSAGVADLRAWRSARRWASDAAAAARPAPRRAAARHRQARGLQPRSSTSPAGSTDDEFARDARAPALHAADPRARRVLRAIVGIAAIHHERLDGTRLPPRAGARSTSRARRASSPSPTSSRR